MRLLITFVVLEAAILAIFLFGDIGFDRPGTFGLDFDKAIVLIVLYVIVLVSGLIVAASHKAIKMFLLQLLLPLVAIAAIYWPRTRFEVSDYQHLVGKSKAEVEETLGDRNVVLSGFESSEEHGDREFASYDGMTVFYSPEGIVVEVRRDNLLAE